MGNFGKQIKILELCAVDKTVKILLLPLINRLKNNGFDVTISCSKGSISEELVKKGYKIKNINISRNLNILSHIKSVIKLIKLMRTEKFDIVHVHTPVAGLLGRVAAKLSGIPIILYTAHGFYFNERMPKLTYWFFCIIEKLAGRFLTSYIFTQSEEDRLTALRKKIIRKDKICTIGNGVDINVKFNPLRVSPYAIAQRKMELGLSNEDRIITFIGRMVMEKGFTDLLLAFFHIRKSNYKLLLVGECDSSERDSSTFKVLREQLKYDRNIIITGMCWDINKLLFMSDIFVLPSYREGMPRSILEAMAMGKPVIATDIRGCREEVVHGRTGYLVPAGSIKELAYRMQDILEKPKLQKRMGEEARRCAEELYDEEKVLNRQLSIIRVLLNKHIENG
jgi:glycosyltransferase involved in cell wall biosynthesis